VCANGLSVLSKREREEEVGACAWAAVLLKELDLNLVPAAKKVMPSTSSTLERIDPRQLACAR
jgi:hypothetical protein